MKIAAHTWNSGFEHGTRLYDLKFDPKRETLIENPEVEARLKDQMIQRMNWDDAHLEQFQRMGLSNHEK